MTQRAAAGATAMQRLLDTVARPNPGAPWLLVLPHVVLLCVVWTILCAIWHILGWPWGP